VCDKTLLSVNSLISALAHTGSQAVERDTHIGTETSSADSSDAVCTSCLGTAVIEDEFIIVED